MVRNSTITAAKAVRARVSAVTRERNFMSKYLRPILAGILGGILFFVVFSLLSSVLPNFEKDRFMFGLGSLMFVLFGVVEAISRAFRK